MLSIGRSPTNLAESNTTERYRRPDPKAEMIAVREREYQRIRTICQNAHAASEATYFRRRFHVQVISDFVRGRTRYAFPPVERFIIDPGGVHRIVARGAYSYHVLAVVRFINRPMFNMVQVDTPVAAAWVCALISRILDKLSLEGFGYVTLLCCHSQHPVRRRRLAPALAEISAGIRLRDRTFTDAIWVLASLKFSSAA